MIDAPDPTCIGRPRPIRSEFYYADSAKKTRRMGLTSTQNRVWQTLQTDRQTHYI